MRKLLVLATLVLLLAGYAWSARQNEQVLNSGKSVLLRLAPVDPRALLMGDYMILDFALNRDISQALQKKHGVRDKSWSRSHAFDVEEASALPASGRAVLRLDADGVASFVRLDDGAPLEADELLLRYRVRGNRAYAAATAFYFQEGHGDAYARAVFGEVRVDPSGKSLLATLRDEDGKTIEPGAQTQR